MKLFFAFLLLSTTYFQHTAFAQEDNTVPAYIQFKEMPAFTIRLIDSSLINTYDIEKGKNTVLVYFSPDCNHCHTQAQEIISKSGQYKHTNFYFITSFPLDTIRAFARQYHADQLPNILWGKDEPFFIPRYYSISYVPFFVVYDKKKKLKALYKDNVKTEVLLDLIKN